MIEIVLTLLVAGQATFYNPNIFERVVAYRQGIGQIQPCAECIGYVALLEPEHIGTQVWLRRPGEDPIGPFLVVDCGPQDPKGKAALKARGWAVDVDPDLAKAWRMRGPLANIEVWQTKEKGRESGGAGGDGLTWVYANASSGGTAAVGASTDQSSLSVSGKQWASNSSDIERARIAQ